MKKPRAVTPEEKRLWREATKHDDKMPWTPEDGEIPEEEGELLVESAPVARAVLATQPKMATPTAKLSVQDGRGAKRLLKPHAPIEATLDLHGLNKTEAYVRLQAFVRTAHAAGKRHVLVITGKGRTGEGILRANVPQWLNEPVLRPLVSGIAHARPERGGSGVLHLLLKRKK